MGQNLISLTLNEQQLAAVDQALTELEAQLIGLVALNKETRRAVPKMGAKSETFCRQTLLLLGQNPQVVPPSMVLADAEADRFGWGAARDHRRAHAYDRRADAAPRQ
jgi:hypothetical protein